jgi:hypothetical protein
VYAGVWWILPVPLLAVLVSLGKSAISFAIESAFEKRMTIKKGKANMKPVVKMICVGVGSAFVGWFFQL